MVLLVGHTAIRAGPSPACYTSEMTTPVEPSERFDVAIVGGGPAGSTAASLIRKYSELSVVVLEKEIFPRDHVGESQLPPIGAILEEMGCWQAVEEAQFPIKIGATYRWGRNTELWDFEFLPTDAFKDEQRPAPYAGQRKQTALQVDRARYDDILLRHAEALGSDVRQDTRVTKVHRSGDRIDALELATGKRIQARHYIDASGHVGVLRHALDVAVDVPTRLKNIAMWDYWENAEWAVEIGVGGTRVQVMSQAEGWLWFIPLGPTRTSIGFICPAEHYKDSGSNAESLYLNAIANDDRISGLVKNARRRGKVESTKDWSFLAERTAGENWFLAGESAGFADPILAAGMTLAHTGAREAAYSILAMETAEHDTSWLKHHYDRNQRSRILQHIRFADFWYASNGQFSDLQEHCRTIAEEAGLRLNSEEAWSWLARGGFSNDIVGQASVGGIDLAAMKQITQRFTEMKANWLTSQGNVFELSIGTAEKTTIPAYRNGTIQAVPSFHRGEHTLVLTGMFALVHKGLERTSDAVTLLQLMQNTLAKQLPAKHVAIGIHHALQALEVMLSEGWVTSRHDPTRPCIELHTPDEGPIVHKNRDPN